MSWTTLRISVRLALREILREPRRTLLTLLGITIGVAAIVAVSLTARSSDEAFSGMYRSLAREAGLEITSVDGSSMEQSILESVIGVPGVQLATGQVQRQSLMTFRDRRIKILLLGIDPAQSESQQRFPVVEGQSLAQKPGILVEQ
ncbi:MAG: ABC transporter permease [Planctomycetales bacterium]|nr:ABC transporter permease [Planctomycetales bacterium]